MKYDLSKPEQAKEAQEYLDKALSKSRRVEIKLIAPRRSLAQNAYLHLLLGAFGSHFGYTIEEAKTIYKEISKDIYFYGKKGRTFMRSSADLTKEELAVTVDRFMKKSAEAGYELPLATDQEWLMQLDNQIEKTRSYL